MEQYILALILAATTIGLSLFLVSKRQHCYAINHLALIMLFFAAMISTQPMGRYHQIISVLCNLTMVACIAIFFWDISGEKRRYFIKDIDISQEGHLQKLQMSLRTYINQESSSKAKVDLSYRILTISGATEKQRQGCRRIVNQYLKENQWDNSKDWRIMVIVASTALVIAMIIQAAYYYFNGFPI